MQGPKWSSDGTYTIVVAYDGKLFEKTFMFKTKQQTAPTDSTEQKQKVPEKEPQVSQGQEPVNLTKDPKTIVSGFPDPKKSPQSYFDLYYGEPEYKQWFDKAFPSLTIEQAVGYPSTHISDFPDNNNPPQYYVDRYYNEQIYRDWFDSQFPNKSIFDVLGYPESLFQKFLVG